MKLRKGFTLMELLLATMFLVFSLAASLMLFANFVLIYVPGLLQLNLWLNLVSGSTIGFAQTLTMGLLPFIAGDVVKVVAAALAARGLLPKFADNTNMDRSK